MRAYLNEACGFNRSVSEILEPSGADRVKGFVRLSREDLVQISISMLSWTSASADGALRKRSFMVSVRLTVNEMPKSRR